MEMGRGRVVRHRVLIPFFEGSKPSVPYFFLNKDCFLKQRSLMLERMWSFFILYESYLFHKLNGIEFKWHAAAPESFFFSGKMRTWSLNSKRLGGLFIICSFPLIFREVSYLEKLSIPYLIFFSFSMMDVFWIEMQKNLYSLFLIFYPVNAEV